jgi:hypothetical protein
MRNWYRYAAAVLAAVLAGHVAVTTSAHAQQQGAVTLPLQGIDIDINPDGSWKAIYATGVQTVSFPDRRGINNAYVVAEERAKAAIARYFEQKVTTGRIYTEAEESLEKTLRTRGNGNDAMTAEASRTLKSSLQETFSSSAQAVLRGVTILEQRYDEKAEEVTVKVGISRETIAIARSAQQGMQATASGGGGGAAGAAGRGDGVTRPPTEVRTRPMPGSGPVTSGAPAPALRSFIEARGYVRGLRLRSRAEWDELVRSGDLPKDIPTAPEKAYPERWVSWEDWLGINN